MNFAYLASFQAIYFMDPPVPKTIDIFVCEMNLQGVILSKTFFTKYCIICILYITMFMKSNHTIGKLSHSHPQFPCLTLGTPGPMIPLLMSKTEPLAFYDSGFPMKA